MSLTLIKQYLNLFTKNERRLLVLLICFQAFAAILEALSIASIFPFMALVSDYSKVFSDPNLSYLYKLFHFEKTEEFVVFIGTSVASLLIIGASVRALTAYLQLRITTHLDFLLGTKLATHYLSLDYLHFKTYNTSDFTKNVFTECSNTVTGAMVPILNIISQSFILICILIILCVTNLLITLAVVFFIITIYFIILRTLSKKLQYFGKLRFESNAQRFKWLKETCDNYKVLRVMKRTNIFFFRV